MMHPKDVDRMADIVHLNKTAPDLGLHFLRIPFFPSICVYYVNYFAVARIDMLALNAL